ncbi:MAG TPA: sigma-70 family RNA polymerase sigma factor [Candidatus Baltobacteraceae bacterium]|jgi:RNA polymerase sigma-70 factor (ECF subfamily)|nr:sigma-70 family RNA polymerase sigma factor [Candidatus Baltobacteraceae bacterium]
MDADDELKTETDEELARQTQGGSLAAFEKLVVRYEQRVFAFAMQWRRNPTDAREVTQDTFVRAFQAISQLNCRLAFAPWLFAIARRKCIDSFRAQRPMNDEPPPEQPDFNDPAELLAREEDRQDTWRIARRHLPDTQFQAIWLRYVEEMNVPDIARAMGKTQIAVRVILFRARQALATKLDRAGREARREPAPLPSLARGGNP